jgi:hypothetical protein
LVNLKQLLGLSVAIRRPLGCRTAGLAKTGY